MRVEVVDADVLRHAALVALPSPEIAENAVVSNLRTIGRVRGQPAFVERQRLWKPAIDADAVQTAKPVVEGVAPREINDVLRVRRPGNDFILDSHALGDGIASRMERQLPWLAALRRHYVHVIVAVILRRERDPFPVRRELPEQFFSGITRNTARNASFPPHQPQISAVAEDNLVLAYIRKAH